MVDERDLLLRFLFSLTFSDNLKDVFEDAAVVLGRLGTEVIWTADAADSLRLAVASLGVEDGLFAIPDVKTLENLSDEVDFAVNDFMDAWEEEE